MTTGTALAEESWILSASGAGARSFHDANTEYFQQGATGSFGAYHSVIPKLQFGARVGGTWIPADEEAPSGYDSGDLGMGMATAMMRVRPLGTAYDDSRAEGLWIEAGGGPALVGNEMTAAGEAGIGYNFDVGSITVGPNFRYMQAIEVDNRFVSEDVRIGAIGVEFTFLDKVAPKQRAAQVEPLIGDTKIVNNFSVPTPDRDADGIVDGRDACPDLRALPANDADNDGCPGGEVTKNESTTVRLQEPVFFATDSAALSAEGKDTLKEVATRYLAASDEWKSIRVIGHADKRGAMGYNAELATARARAVKKGLAQMGVPADKIDVSSWGESMPLTPKDNTVALGLNRRVEFLVEL